MQPSEQIEKLHEAMTLLNRGNATTEDVTKLFGLLLKAVDSVKSQLSTSLDTSHGELSDAHQRLKSALGSIENRLTVLGSTLAETKNVIESNTNDLVLKIFREIKAVEAQIPTLPDLKPLEARIEAVAAKILPPKQLGPYEIRDNLEKLVGEERLDASAIKNLPKLIKESKTYTGGTHVIAGQNIRTNGAVVSLNIPIQPTAPLNPNENDLWIDNS